MTLLSTLSVSYRQSPFAGQFASVAAGGQTGNPTSPYHEMIGSLGVLRQNDPTLYNRVMQEVTASIQAKVDGLVDLRELVKREKMTWTHLVANRFKGLGVL